MARHYRFFLRNNESWNLILEEKYELLEKTEPEIFFQLVKVLRAGQGDLVTLMPMGKSDGRSDLEAMRRAGVTDTRPMSSFEYDFEVVSVTKKAVGFLKKGVRETQNELSFPLTLWLCFPNKTDKLEFILQKAVEIGVTEIKLFQADFSQKTHVLRFDRLGKILLEAAEQSERNSVPEFTAEGRLSDMLGHALEAEKNDEFAERFGNVWVAMERMGKASEGIFGAGAMDGGSASKNIDWRGITVLIGPEGGFSEAEKALLMGLPFHKFSLGKRVLRMERAAIVSLGLAAMRDS